MFVIFRSVVIFSCQYSHILLITLQVIDLRNIIARIDINSTRLGHRQFCLFYDVMQRGATVPFLTLRLAPDFSPVLLSLIFMELGTSLLYIA